MGFGVDEHPSVSYVVPCFQEEEALAAFAPLLPRIAACEVVFIDDGSTDDTARALDALAQADPRVRVLTHERNRGVGAAMRTGIAATSGEVVVVYDVDVTYPLEDAATLVEEVRDGADLATASPFVEGGTSPDVPWPRLLLSRGAVAAYRWALGPGARHVATFTCAFRAYRGPWIRALGFESDGFSAAAEILGRALLEGRRVVEVPSTLTPRQAGESKMRVGRALVGHLAILRRLRALRRAGPPTRTPSDA